MKLLLEVPDNKANALLEVLREFWFVKSQQLTDSKAILFSDLRVTVLETNLVKATRKKAKNAEDFINEL